MKYRIILEQEDIEAANAAHKPGTAASCCCPVYQACRRAGVDAISLPMRRIRSEDRAPLNGPTERVPIAMYALWLASGAKMDLPEHAQRWIQEADRRRLNGKAPRGGWPLDLPPLEFELDVA